MHRDTEREDCAATLLKAMENEHCAGADARDEFTSTNGITTYSKLEWEIVASPKKRPETPDGTYPERADLRLHQPQHCRVPRSIEYMKAAMEGCANGPLRKGGHAEMILEELVAGRL